MSNRKCIDCSNISTYRGDYIYCDKCIVFRREKAAQNMNQLCKNYLTRHKGLGCASDTEINITQNKFDLWPKNYVMHKIFDNGFVYLQNICVHCDIRISKLKSDIKLSHQEVAKLRILEENAQKKKIELEQDLVNKIKQCDDYKNRIKINIDKIEQNNEIIKQIDIPARYDTRITNWKKRQYHDIDYNFDNQKYSKKNEI